MVVTTILEMRVLPLWEWSALVLIDTGTPLQVFSSKWEKLRMAKQVCHDNHNFGFFCIFCSSFFVFFSPTFLYLFKVGFSLVWHCLVCWYRQNIAFILCVMRLWVGDGDCISQEVTNRLMMVFLRIEPKTCSDGDCPRFDSFFDWFIERLVDNGGGGIFLPWLKRVRGVQLARHGGPTLWDFSTHHHMSSVFEILRPLFGPDVSGVSFPPFPFSQNCFVHPFSFCTSFTFDIVFFTQFGKSLGLLTVRRDIRIDHGGVGDGQSGLRFRLFNRHGLPGLGSPRYESVVVWLWRICAWRGFGV